VIGPNPLGAAVGILLDRAIGELPISPHPVALLGRALAATERTLYRDSRLPGVAHAVAGTMLGAVAGATIGPTAVATYVAVAGRALGDAALAVSDALAAGDLEEARTLMPALVGRDPSAMDEKELSRATVESVAENTVDAVVAPALWGALLGAAGAGVYRAVNTMDSMVGHRSARYERYGWAAARLDDAAGFVPARVTAALVATVRPRQAGAVWRAVLVDAPKHPSPNAGVAEAAFAGALGLRLGGENRYGDRVERRASLGNGRAPSRTDIERAVSLSRDVSLALAGMLGAAALVPPWPRW